MEIDNPYLTPELRQALEAGEEEAKRRAEREKKTTMTVYEARELIGQVKQEHVPCVPGNPESYSEYNMGWRDALDRLDSLIPMG